MGACRKMADPNNLRTTETALSSIHSEMEFIRYALDSAAIVAMTDVRGTITFVNRKFCEISGYSREELIGNNHRMLHSGIHDVAFFRVMYRRIGTARFATGERMAPTTGWTQPSFPISLLKAKLIAIQPSASISPHVMRRKRCLDG